MKKEKEDLDEISNELELADEEDKVPYENLSPVFSRRSPASNRSIRYKIGDTFVSLPVSEVQELLASNAQNIEESVAEIKGTISSVREDMEQLKVQLYARFGKSINLDA